MCAPLDLAGCGHHLARGFNRLYTQHFLKTLKAVSAKRLQRFPGLFDAARMQRASNLYQFDDAVTGPVHGFAGADDYWQRASAKPWLRSISIPALVVNPNSRQTAVMSALSAVLFREIWTGCRKGSYTTSFSRRHNTTS